MVVYNLINFGLKVIFFFWFIYGLYCGLYFASAFICLMFSLMLYADRRFKQQDKAWSKLQEDKARIEYTTLEIMSLHECEASADFTYTPEIE